MKAPLLFLLVSGACWVFAEEPDVQSLDFDWAIQLLTTTTASPSNARTLATATDPQTKSKFEKLLAEQTAALAVLRKSHKEIDLKVLVPFLGFTTDAAISRVTDGDGLKKPDDTAPMENMDGRRREWPVFALILDMPNAAPALEKYCMDQNNPAHCRVDAFHVFMYLNKDRAKKVGDALAAEFQNSIARSTYVPYVERILKGAGGSGFDGPVDDFDRTGYDADVVSVF